MESEEGAYLAVRAVAEAAAAAVAEVDAVPVRAVVVHVVCEHESAN